MKDYSQEELESSRPSQDMNEAIDFCLTGLYRDNTHKMNDVVCYGLSYEELIGALLLARDFAKGVGLSEELESATAKTQFSKWWEKTQGDNMEPSRLVAEKAWIASWFEWCVIHGREL